MREIKFRQPIFENERFSYFHYWGVDLNGQRFIGPVEDKYPETSQEYLELEDSFNVGLYDGDIIEFKFEYYYGDDVLTIDEGGVYVGKISYSDGVVRVGDLCFNHASYEDGCTIKKIGNIYENPELLKDCE